MQIFSKKDFNTAKFTTILNEVENLVEKKKIIQDWQATIDSGKIFQSNEQELQAEFLYKFFGEILGYTYDLHAQERNLRREVKTHTDSTKPDGALGYFRFEENESTEDVRVVIELKDANTNLDKKQYSKNLKMSPVEQAFSYAPKFSGKVKWVIVSNFVEIRLYHASDSNKYELFEIEKLLREEELAKFFFLLKKDRLFLAKQESIIDSLLAEKRAEEEKITKEFYFEYRAIRELLFYHLLRDNPTKSPNDLLSCAQKLIDKVVFMAFVRDVIPMSNILGDLIRSMDYINFRDENVLWFLLKGTIRSFHKGYNHKVPRFNGGLFKPDALLESLTFREADLHELIQFVLKYDFQSQLNVNILGHIFEQSIADLEEIKTNILNKKIEDKDDISLDKIKQNIISKRKSDGVFYTPEYITDFIIQKSLGFYLEQEKERLLHTHQTETEDFWKEYKKILAEVKVLDPACGSGAFLTQVFAFLWNEWKIVLKESEKFKIQPLLNGKTKSKNNGKEAGFFEKEDNFIPEEWEIKKSIIQNNLFGVDLNPESVEITKLALWLLHANKTTSLSDLSQNVKQGNSVISDKSFTPLAFDWEKEFPFQFDVIVGNPPYVSANNMDFRVRQHIKDNEEYEYLSGKWDLFLPFIERGLKLLKSKGILSFIIPYGFLNQGFATKMRQWILEKFTLKAIADLHENKIFEDATVPTCIPFILNDIKNNNNTIIYHLEKEEFSISHTIETEKYKKSEMFMFRTENLDKHFALLNKIKGIGTQIEKHFYVSTGAEIHGKEERDALGNFISGYSRSEILETKNLVNHQPFIEGAAIPKDLELGKYCFPEIQYYINYDKHFAKMRSPKFKELFENQKIIIRKVSGLLGILATLDERKIYTSEGAILIIDINTIKNEKRTNNKTSIFSLKVLLAILNSKLMYFYYQRIYGGFVNVFPNYIKPLPIPSLVSKEITKRLEERVEIALQTQKKLTLSSERFLTVMRGEFKDIKFNEKLALWHRLEWQDFVQEMRKVKAVFTKKQALEWVGVYEEEREKILSLQNIFRKAILEIDELVYELYDLNELEIKQIENEYEKK